MSSQPTTNGKDKEMRTNFRPKRSIKKPPERAPNKAPRLTNEPTMAISVLSNFTYQTLSSFVTCGGTVAFWICCNCGWTGDDHPRKLPRMKAPHEAMNKRKKKIAANWRVKFQQNTQLMITGNRRYEQWRLASCRVIDVAAKDFTGFRWGWRISRLQILALFEIYVLVRNESFINRCHV